MVHPHKVAVFKIWMKVNVHEINLQSIMKRSYHQLIAKKKKMHQLRCKILRKKKFIGNRQNISEKEAEIIISHKQMQKNNQILTLNMEKLTNNNENFEIIHTFFVSQGLWMISSLFFFLI